MIEYPIQLAGGLDTEAPSLKIPPGCLIGSENYETKVEGGYERQRGIERYDGRPRPSDAEVSIIGCDGVWGGAAVVGASVAGAISGATGVICYITTTVMAVTKVTGTFRSGENITVGGITVGLSTGEPSTSQLVLNEMLAGAADEYRGDIEVVPGEGPVCGVCVVDDVLYAFRNNVGSTKQVVWKATTAGWVAIDYPDLYLVGFNNGSDDMYAGFESGVTTVSDLVGNTAVVHKVVVQGSDTGTFGYLVLRGPSTPDPLNATPPPGFATALSSGPGLRLLYNTYTDYGQHTLRPSGRWQFRPYQFSEAGIASGSTPVYGVDLTADGGGGNFIEFDGQAVVPIFASDPDLALYPERLECHKNHLFLAIRKSLWFSAIGNPYSFTVFDGGGEVVIGDFVTEMMSIQGSEDQGAMLVCCANKSQVVYGNDSSDWKMVPLSREVGAKAYSMRQLGQTLAFDEQGVRDFSPTQSFGNFGFNTVTNHIKRKLRGKTVTASVISRVHNRYRLFFDDGTFLSGTPGKRWSWTFGRYPFTVLFADEFEINGVSRVFVSGDDGYVYECDVGRSFDGEAIEAWAKTAYAHMGKPGMRKAFRRFDLDIVGESAGEMQIQPDYSFGDTNLDAVNAASVANVPVPPPASPWDIGSWDNGTWDGQYVTRVRCRRPGVGENVSLLFYSNSASELSHTLQSVTDYFLPRRQTR